MELKNRSFLKLLDYTPAEIGQLLELAADLKAKKLSLIHIYRLRGDAGLSGHAAGAFHPRHRR